MRQNFHSARQCHPSLIFVSQAEVSPGLESSQACPEILGKGESWLQGKYNWLKTVLLVCLPLPEKVFPCLIFVIRLGLIWVETQHKNVRLELKRVSMTKALAYIVLLEHLPLVVWYLQSRLRLTGVKALIDKSFSGTIKCLARVNSGFQRPNCSSGVFVIAKQCHPSLIFLIKAGAYPSRDMAFKY